MTDIIAVTTFNKEGLDLYAQKFLDSWAKNTDDNMKLVAYAEKCEPVNPAPNKILVLDQATALPKLMKFKKDWGRIPMANGVCPWPAKRPRDYHKAFKWDAIRFSNKVYSVFDACERYQDSWVVWMDADMVTSGGVCLMAWKVAWMRLAPSPQTKAEPRERVYGGACTRSMQNV